MTVTLLYVSRPFSCC